MSEKNLGYNAEYNDGHDGKFYTIPMEPLMREQLESISKHTVQELNSKHKIIIPHAWQANTIANCFIENLIKYMTAKMQMNGTAIESVNFNDTLEFHLSYKQNEDAEKEGNINITIRPGINAKLLVKSDTFTEDDED